jgi:hypothetical protein
MNDKRDETAEHPFNLMSKALWKPENPDFKSYPIQQRMLAEYHTIEYAGYFAGFSHNSTLKMASRINSENRIGHNWSAFAQTHLTQRLVIRETHECNPDSVEKIINQTLSPDSIIEITETDNSRTIGYLISSDYNTRLINYFVKKGRTERNPNQTPLWIPDGRRKKAKKGRFDNNGGIIIKDIKDISSISLLVPEHSPL